jgi:Porin PorA
VKRVFGWVALVVGLFLVLLVPLILLYSVPRISKAPTDTDQNVVSNGSATYFSAKQLQLVGPTAVQNIEVFKGDPPASTATVAVIHYTSHLVNRQTKASISYDKETYAMDRNTGLAMNCCGESPKMSGETVKFPFGTKKITYQLWDPSANASFPVHYARTEDLEGVTSYVLLGTSPKVQIGTIGLPNSLLGVQGQGLTTVPQWYQADTTVWVEPVTGQVLKGEKHVHQWAGDQSGAPLLELADLHVQYSDATVSYFVDQAKKNVKQLNLAKRGIPVGGGIVGLILALLGLFLLREPRRRLKLDSVVPAPA